MFRTFRFKLAVLRVAFDLFERGLIDKKTQQLIFEVAGGGWNRELGVQSLKSGASRSANAAAALVFARLAIVSERTPSGPVTHEVWQSATVQALRRAGAENAESYLAAALLYQNLKEEGQ